VCQKKSCAGQTQLKGKQVAFVKWISEMANMILFHHGCGGRVKIRRMNERERKQS